MLPVANVTSFAPVADRGARVLVLGSMPGAVSLQQQRYYAHPRNAFWPIAAELCGFDPALPYARRIERLRASGVALWDVLRSCHRPGSLDSDIDPASVEPNAFAEFFAKHEHVRAVFCNGGAAFRLYRQRVVPTLAAPFAGLPVTQLPSSSPAHASRSFDDKRRAWLAAIGPVLGVR